MKATEISRVSLAEISFKGISEDLDLRSIRIFGYTSTSAIAMARTLHGAQVEPLNTRDVERYKQSKLKRTISAFAKIWLGWAVLLQTLAISTAATHLSAGWWAALLAFTLTGSVTIGIYTDGRKNTHKETRWERVPLGNYGNYIPEFVLSKAIALKTANPNIRLQVEYLYTFKKVSYPDPFLVANIGKKVVYIDVWDEPEFERQTR